MERIDHDRLLFLVAERVSDRRVLKLLRQWLRAGVLADGWSPRRSGDTTGRGHLINKRGRNLPAGQTDRWHRTWFHDQDLHKLMGTIRYPKEA